MVMVMKMQLAGGQEKLGDGAGEVSGCPKRRARSCEAWRGVPELTAGTAATSTEAPMVLMVAVAGADGSPGGTRNAARTCPCKRPAQHDMFTHQSQEASCAFKYRQCRSSAPGKRLLAYTKLQEGVRASSPCHPEAADAAKPGELILQVALGNARRQVACRAAPAGGVGASQVVIRRAPSLTI